MPQVFSSVKEAWLGVLSGTVNPVRVTTSWRASCPNIDTHCASSRGARSGVLARHESRRRRNKKKTKRENSWSGTLLFGFLTMKVSTEKKLTYIHSLTRTYASSRQRIRFCITPYPPLDTNPSCVMKCHQLINIPSILSPRRFQVATRRSVPKCTRRYKTTSVYRATNESLVHGGTSIIDIWRDDATWAFRVRWWRFRWWRWCGRCLWALVNRVRESLKWVPISCR